MTTKHLTEREFFIRACVSDISVAAVHDTRTQYLQFYLTKGDKKYIIDIPRGCNRFARYHGTMVSAPQAVAIKGNFKFKR